MPDSLLSSPLAILIGILCLTACIFIHELGHFLAARWRGAHVPRFSVFGLGNPILKRTWRGVEWCICWIPFGAYVQIPQLADLGEIEGGEADKDAPPRPPLGYLDKVIVAGIDATTDALAAMQAGELEVTVFQNAAAQGQGSVDTALKIAKGEKSAFSLLRSVQLSNAWSLRWLSACSPAPRAAYA